MSVTFSERLDVYRRIAHVRYLRQHLAPFAAHDKQPKLTPSDRRHLFDLLHAIDALLPGCPDDQVLFRSPLDGESDFAAWEQRLREVVGP